jgi:hypothetical protein
VAANHKPGAAERKIRTFEAANQEAAAIILRDPTRYPGLMTEWALMVTARRQKSAAGPATEESQAATMRKTA